MREKILILENDLEEARLLETTLNQENYEVLKAARISDAQAVLFSRPLDLIVIDRILPDQEGLNFAKEIRGSACLRYAGILFLSARTRLQDKLDGLAAGADDYLNKPFSPEELVGRIKAVLRFVSPMLHPQSRLPGPLALEKECERLGPAKNVTLHLISLAGFETFKSLFPDKLQPFQTEVGEFFYKELSTYKMEDFLAQLQEDCFVLASTGGHGEELVDRIKKNFAPIRKKFLRQSALDFFRKPPESLLNLHVKELPFPLCAQPFPKVAQSLQDFRRSLDYPMPNPA